MLMKAKQSDDVINIKTNKWKLLYENEKKVFIYFMVSNFKHDNITVIPILNGHCVLIITVIKY